MAELSKQALKVQNNTEFPNNNAGLITPTKLRGFNVDMIDSLVDEISYNVDSGSWNQQIDSLENFTASLGNTFVSTASFNSFTQSFNSFSASVTQSIVDLQNFSASLSGGFVTEGELQAATASLINQINTKTDTSSFNAYTSQANNRLTNLEAATASIDSSITQLNASSASQQISINALNVFTASQSTASIESSITNLNSATQSLFTSASLGLTTASVSLNTITFSKGDGSTFNLTVDTGSGGGGSVPAGTISGSAQITALGFVSSSVTGSSLVTASASGNTITFTKGDASTFNVTVSGGSGVTFEKPSIETISGSVLITANTFNSGAANLLHISASAQNQANLLFKTNNNAGSTIVSGSLNIYANGSAPAAGRLNYLENSNIFLNDSGFLPTVTASVLTAGGTYPRMRNNLWLGTGPWTINTNAFASSSVQAGSFNNNLFLGSTGTTLNTLGNTGGIAFSHNILAQASATINAPSRSLAEIAAGASGSSVVNFLNNAAFGGTITYNGPVSASASQTHTISGNSVQGTLTLNLQSGSRAHSITNNILNGTLTVNDNTVFTPALGGTTTISQTNINGAITLTNRASASFNLTANNLGGFTITNDYDSSTNGSVGRSFVLQGNVMLGFIANNIYFSGSAAGTGTTNDRGRGFYGNLIGGSRISASVIGDGNKHFLASAVWGQGLSVYGTGIYDASNASIAGGQNGGSAFFGRWNAEDGNRAGTAQTVFAVGTGNSGSTGIVRKTGFLIDSSSNAFFEGNHFISGNTNITDNLIVTGSLTASLQTGYMYVGNAGGLTQAIPTSSLAVENSLTASIARNLIVIARNGGSSTLPAGTVVHITSAVGDNPIFTTASYDTEALSSNTFGLLRYSSPSGADVEVVVAGVVTGVDTDPALGYTAGDIVYLSSSGQFTRVQPQAPNQIVTLGQVLRAQQNNGSIYVSINNGWELNELHNVQIINPQTGDIIQYESASYGLWKNKSLSAAGVATTGSNSFIGTETISGSLIITGSARGNVQALTVTSNTASIDFGAANYFTLTLPTSSTTHFTGTNIQPGLSATLVLTTGTGGTGASASFAPAFLQPSGSIYAPTSGSAKKDVLSFVAVDSTNVYVVATKNMI
jgi:hypothetical protein